MKKGSNVDFYTKNINESLGILLYKQIDMDDEIPTK